MARGHGGRRIDYKQWTVVGATQASFTTDGTGVGGSLGFAVPGTILRCRCFISALMDSNSQVGDDMGLTFGLGIVSTDAVAAGSGSLPDPGDEPEYPWLWWGDMVVHSETTTPISSWGPHAQLLQVDTKAMRRVKPGQSLVWVIQRSGTSGAPTVIIDIGQTRVLFGT